MILYARAQADIRAVKLRSTHSHSSVQMAGKVLVFWLRKFCYFLTETFQTASSNSVLWERHDHTYNMTHDCNRDLNKCSEIE